MESILLVIATLVASARLLGTVFERYGYSQILGEILAGIILGPTLLGWIVVNDAMGNLTALGSDLRIFADLGVFFLMFVIGMKMNIRELHKVSKGAILTTLLGMLMPFSGGYFLGVYFGLPSFTSFVLAVCMSITSLVIIAQLLEDFKLLRTRLGETMLGAGVFSDMIGLFMLSIIISLMNPTGVSVTSSIIDTVIKVAVYFGAAAFAGLYIVPPLVEYAWHLKTKQLAFTVTTVLLLIFSIVAEYLGVGGIVGAFLAGVFVRHGIHRRREAFEIIQEFSALSIGFLTPLFFTWLGLVFDMSGLVSGTQLFTAIVLVAFFGKFVGSALGSWLTFGNMREAMLVGIGMNTKAAVELVIAERAWQGGVITQDIFSMLVLMAILTTFISPIIFKHMLKNFKVTR